MGEKYVQQPTFDINIMYDEMTLKTPGFFVLFPGVDPTEVPLVDSTAPIPFPRPVHEAGVGKLPKAVAFEQLSP